MEEHCVHVFVSFKKPPSIFSYGRRVEYENVEGLLFASVELDVENLPLLQ